MSGSARPVITFLIASLDGRTRICTASPEQAVAHFKALRASGTGAVISDITGKSYTLKSLHKYADPRIGPAKSLGSTQRRR